MTRHQVFGAMTRPLTWAGVDRGVFIAALAAGLAIMSFTKTATGMIVALSVGLAIAVAGAIALKYDPAYPRLLPALARFIDLRLLRHGGVCKRHYE